MSFGSGVDAASLREALAVIDDWEDDVMELFGIDETAPRVPTPRTRPCPPRQRRKAELELLRRELQHLEAVDGAWLAQSQRHGVPTAQLGLRVECWEMCQRQRLQRRQAEQENTKLRELLTALKLDMLKAERLLQRSLAVKRVLPRMPAPAPFFEAYRGPCVELPEQFFRLELLRHEKDHVLSSGMFAQNAHRRSFKDIQFRDCRPADDRVEILFGMAWVVPFDLDEVEAAMWTETTRIAPREKHVEWKDLYVNDSVIVSQFIATPFAGVDPGVKHGQTATRRLPRASENHEAAIVSIVQLRKFEFEQWRGEAFADVWVCVKELPSTCGPLTQVK